MPHRGGRRGGERIFIGILLDGEARQRFASWQRRNSAIGNVRWKSREKLHITLFFFDSPNTDGVSRLSDLAASLAQRLSPFSIIFRPRMASFRPKTAGGDHIYIARPVETEHLRMLHRQLRTGFRYGHHGDPHRRFVAHMTLGKSSRNIPLNIFLPLPSVPVRVTHLAVISLDRKPNGGYAVLKRCALH